MSVSSVSNPQRSFILDQIEKVMSKDSFDNELYFGEDNKFLGFTSYEEFMNAQHSILNQSDNQLLNQIVFIITQIVPQSSFFESLDRSVTEFSGVVFDSNSRFVFV